MPYPFTTIATDSQLTPGQSWASPDGLITLKFQVDGNIVLYNGGTSVLWSPNVSNGSPSVLALQGDGNLVAYRNGTAPPAGDAYYASNTAGRSGCYGTLSDDGTFALRDSGGNAFFTQGGGVTPPPAPPPGPGVHRFWRLFIDSGNDGSNISANNIEFHATVGGPTICTGGNGTSSSQYSSWNINLAFSNTGQFATAGGAPQWVAYDLGVGVYNAVAEVVWQARTDGYSSQTPNACHMEYSDDGTTWTQFGVGFSFGDSSTWSTGQTKTAAITQPPPQSVSKLAEYVVEGPPPIPQAVSKMAAYVVEGPPQIPQAVSKLAQYVVEGAIAAQYVSKLAAYVVEGPPSEVRNLSQAMMGTF